MRMKNDLKNYSMKELAEQIDELQKKNKRITRWMPILFGLLGALIGIIILLALIGIYEGYFIY